MEKPKTVLIADDSLFMRSHIKRLLESNGFKVIAEGSNGLQAIELFKAHSPDFTILDITMDNLSGIGALKEIINMDQSAKVIMCSALGQKGMIEEAVSIGAIDFVIKPYFDNLVPILKKFS